MTDATVDDEREIRDLVAAWLQATKAGDTETVMNLITDDAVFMVPGQPPFGKAAFAAASQGQRSVRIEATSTIVELRVLGDWAYLRSHLDMLMTPADAAAPVKRLGYTLTMLRKEADGRWRVARDANLLAEEK